MEITKERKMAYTEVVEILKHVPKKDIEKIPKDIISYYKNNMDTSYDFKINNEKSFEEQEISEQAKVVLAIIYRDYWATEEQKIKIRNKEKYDLEKSEVEKSKIYSEDVFKKEESDISEDKEALVELKKQTWYEKFISFMKKILKLK